ncbi:ribosylnicotinamide kinase [Serendipita sp. 399]|nr:ribosylnicotinamide kinase [Serendipita sp. 399]
MAFLRRVKDTGILPEDHKSHDGLNKQEPVPISDDALAHWRSQFQEMHDSAKRDHGVELVWGLVDGFLLYWHPGIIKELDVRVFLRVSYSTLKSRRERRFGYHTAVQFSPEGSFWRDPPGYWDDIVWPAYLKAHRRIFANGDVDNGAPVTPKDEKDVVDIATEGNPTETPASDESTQCGLPVPGLLVLPAEDMSMEEIFTTTSFLAT